MSHSKINLAELVFEDVNADYGWGKYGEFKVLIRKSDGYINASKLCKDGGKLLGNWIENKTSSILIEEVHRSIGIPIDSLLCQVVQGPNDLRGTYVHNALIPHIASWVSPKFAVKVSQIVNEFLLREHRMEVRRLNQELDVKQDKIDELLVEVREQREESKQQTMLLQEQKVEIEALLTEVSSMNDKLDTANENTLEVLHKLGAVSERQVPLDRIPARNRECLIILHCSASSAMPYYVLRAQRRICETILVRKLQEDPSVRVVCSFDTHPNPREEYLCFKKRAIGQIFARGNKFALLRGATEASIVNLLNQVHREKMAEYERETVEIDAEEEEHDSEANRPAVPAPAQEPVPVPAYTAESLLLRPTKELKELARGTSGRGWSKLRKTELVNWLLVHLQD